MFEKMMPRDKKFRMVVLLLVDICVIQFSSFMGLWMRFDMRLQSIPENYRMAAVKLRVINDISWWYGDGCQGML